MSWWTDAREVAADEWDKLRERLFRKRTAYRNLFYRDDGRLNAPAEVVLADLARFCFAYQSTSVTSRLTGAVDPIATAERNGMRKVWLRVYEMLHADERLIYAIQQHQEAA